MYGHLLILSLKRQNTSPFHSKSIIFPYFCRKYAIYCPMNCMNFIKERREVLKITQAELAEFSGTSLRFIRSMEQGKANPSIKTLSNIADILGCEIIVKVKGVEE